MAAAGGTTDSAAMPPTLVTSSVSLATRLGGALDRVRHPRLTRALAMASDGYRTGGVVRVYPNTAAGRRRELLEVGILGRRGYRAPLRIVHEAIWAVGGPSITITFSREATPAMLSDRARAIAERLGALERR